MQETQKTLGSLSQEDSPGVGTGNLLQYSCLENSLDRGTWWATVHGVSKESDTTECTHACFMHEKNQRKIRFCYKEEENNIERLSAVFFHFLSCDE